MKLVAKACFWLIVLSILVGVAAVTTYPVRLYLCVETTMAYQQTVNRSLAESYCWETVTP